jgi:hypothetical protein
MKGDCTVQENDTPLDWRKSAYCSSSGCIEVAVDADAYLVRDSKNPDGPRLTFDQSEWTAFVAGVRAGDFDFN